MKQIVIKIKFLFFFSCFLTQNSFSQISEGGLPYSFKVQLGDDNLETIIIDAPDLSKELEEIKQGIGTNRAGKHIRVDFTPNNSGKWTNLPNGDKLWRIKIHSPEAIGLYMIYEQFELAEGAKLFVYNESKENVLGAFTSKNNPDGGDFITSYTRGNTTILELFEPANANSKIIINQLGYMFKPIPPLNQEDRTGIYKKSSQGYGDAASCLKNVNCSPEGDNWQDEKKSVVRIYFTTSLSATPNNPGFGSWCTGTLINNTALDQKPYILTAYHCQDSPGLTPSTTIFYFNYEAPGCLNPGPLNEPDNTQTVVGYTDKAKWFNSDYALFELNQNVPLNYNPFFAGWDRRNIAPSSGVAIHHSQGDIKKISTESTSIVSGETIQNTFPFAGGANYQGSNYWHLVFDDGFTQGGASGGSLFNQDKRIVGQLLGGGDSNCSITRFDLYGKLSSSWTNGSGGGLQPFLDPSNTAVLTLDSFDGTITINNNVRVREINVNTSPCLFTDATPVEVTVQNFGQNSQTDIPVSYELLDGFGNSLGGGNITATGTLTTSQTTTVNFNLDMEDVGEYTIVARTMLTNDENLGDDEKLKVYNNIKPTIGASGIEITGADEMEGFTVSWTRGNGENSIVLVKEGSEFTPSDLPIDGESYVANSTFPIGDPVGSAIVVYKGDATSVTVSNLDKDKTYYVAVLEFSCVPEDYLLEEVSYESVLVTNLETELANKIDIYPNPAVDYLNINFNDIAFEQAELQIYTTSGKEVKTLTFDNKCRECEVNTEDLATGTYILQINVDGTSIRKRFVKE